MQGKYTITESVKNKATIVAKQRRQHHIDQGTYTGLESKKYWIDGEINGVIFELFFEWFLKKNHIPFYQAPGFVEDTSQLPEWDFQVDGFNVELKTIPPGEKKVRFMVNVESTIVKGGERKGQRKNVDYYLCAKMYDDHLELVGAATKEQVDNLPIRDWNEGDAHWCHKDEMPLTMDEFWKRIGRVPAEL